MPRYPAYLFDLDGTLYRGEEPIPYAAQTVGQLRQEGSLVRFVTNNSSQTREFFCKKLARMGFEPSPNEIYSSGIGTASHLRDEGFRTVFVVGMPGLIETLQDSGLECVAPSVQAEAVAVGICRSFTYDWLAEAMQQLLGGAQFIATNPDTTFPIEGGGLVPGAGSIVAAVQACSGMSPFVVGKPNPFLLELAMRDTGISVRDALAVGDRLDTDIESGLRAGCDTHLVLTGVERRAPDGLSWSEDLRGLLA